MTLHMTTSRLTPGLAIIQDAPVPNGQVARDPDMDCALVDPSPVVLGAL